MKKISKKNRIIALIAITILFIGTSFYLSFPYINNWRSQYSYKLELLGDDHPDEALTFYRKAEFISSNESLYLKIGELYDNSNNLDLAERYFKKIKSEDITLKLVNHYLKAGNIDKASSLLTSVPFSDDYLYFYTLILALDSPKEALGAIPETTDEKLLNLKTYLASIANNTNTEYTDTAIALYLYNHGYSNTALDKLEAYKESKYKDAHILLGGIHTSQGLYKKSAIAYENARVIDPYDVTIYQKLISTYENLENQEKIEKHTRTLDLLLINY